MIDEKEKMIKERSDVEWAMSSPSGRRFIWRMICLCGIYRDIEGKGEEAFKQIGRRQIGLQLLSIISDASEDQLDLMMKEARNNDKEEKLNYERAIKHADNIDTYVGELPSISGDGPNF